MPTAYTQKLVISGKIVELYEYDKWLFYNLTQFDSAGKFMNFTGEIKDLIRSKFSQKRSSFNIRALVNSNPKLNKFLTLTYKENLTDLTKSNYEFQKFIKKIKYQFKNFGYICVVEFQKRGAVHYHLVCDIPYLRKEKIAEIWGNGFIKIKRVDKVRNLGAYFAKHGTKDDEVESKKLAGRKKFFCSRGLNRPIIFRNPKSVKPFIENHLLGAVPFFKKTFSQEGLTVIYSQYKI